ncbi:hypothetical protein AB205_0066480 [Aquarana catesbeiana]|uniref:Uncharacterized protein n=1 Tax=Aquarana catesbeiana TaxID=8400 RepID=A0A2G9RRR3_AQUCT|nr:hypothetical protein AB205_0066480 [Aquarana catesbeiana]
MKSWNAGHNSSNLCYRHHTVTSQSRDRLDSWFSAVLLISVLKFSILTSQI